MCSDLCMLVSTNSTMFFTLYGDLLLNWLAQVAENFSNIKCNKIYLDPCFKEFSGVRLTLVNQMKLNDNWSRKIYKQYPYGSGLLLILCQTFWFMDQQHAYRPIHAHHIDWDEFKYFLKHRHVEKLEYVDFCENLPFRIPQRIIC